MALIILISDGSEEIKKLVKEIVALLPVSSAEVAVSARSAPAGAGREGREEAGTEQRGVQPAGSAAETGEAEELPPLPDDVMPEVRDEAVETEEGGSSGKAADKADKLLDELMSM